MNDFTPIDWQSYNKPPFYQQWLCTDDTLKLAAFGDRNLTDIVVQTLTLKEQWDLAAVKGVRLDRIGKLLQEPRNGKEDETYRLFLILRTMLNTANGSVNHVIKVIKYLYSSETVHIVPDYPAGITILHDGERPDVNFNDIIRQVVGAGISYATKELFYVSEALALDERISAIQAQTSITDYLGYLLHNGVVPRNGTYRHSSGVKEQRAMTLTIGRMQDQLYGRTIHNGLFPRDGTITHNGWAHDPATERLTFKAGNNQTDRLSAEERMACTFFKSIQETVERDFRHNGVCRRNGAMQHTNRVYDTIACTAKSAVQDRLYGALRRNGVVRRDGSERRGGFTGYPHPATEKIAAVTSLSYAELAAIHEQCSGLTVAERSVEDFHKQIRRNGFIRRNGRYNRVKAISESQKTAGKVTSLADTLDECGEVFAIGYRKHRFHNGTYKRNGQCAHDASMLIPLE